MFARYTPGARLRTDEFWTRERGGGLPPFGPLVCRQAGPADPGIPPGPCQTCRREGLADEWAQWVCLAVRHPAAQLVPVPANAGGERAPAGLRQALAARRSGRRPLRRL